MQAVWDQVVQQLAEQVPAQERAAWFTDLAVLAIQHDRIVVGVPNCLARDYVVRQYQAALDQAFSNVLRVPVHVEVVVDTL